MFCISRRESQELERQLMKYEREDEDEDKDKDKDKEHEMPRGEGGAA